MNNLLKLAEQARAAEEMRLLKIAISDCKDQILKKQLEVLLKQWSK